MRIIKLSKDVPGFSSLEACKEYFGHVLPWMKCRFNIQGEKGHIAPDKVDKNEPVVFSYQGQIMAVALIDEPIIEDERVVALFLKSDSLKMIEKAISLEELERFLKRVGYPKPIANLPGWNTIPEEYGKKTLDFLMRREWADFI